MGGNLSYYIDAPDGILTRKILEENVSRLFNLKNLWLCSLKLKRIQVDTFKELNHLELVSLSENQIEEIDPESFLDLSNLKILFLHKNNLKKINAKTFKGLKNLVELYLNENQIEEIAPGAFDSLPSVRVINLYSNKLTQLSQATFRSLALSIGFIDLRGNHFTKTPNFSYFNKSILLKWKPVARIMIGDNYKDIYKIEDNSFYNSAGFKSDFNEFLSQFPDLNRN